MYNILVILYTKYRKVKEIDPLMLGLQACKTKVQTNEAMNAQIARHKKLA